VAALFSYLPLFPSGFETFDAQFKKGELAQYSRLTNSPRQHSEALCDPLLKRERRNSESFFKNER
jgi:hypothetical protein